METLKTQDIPKYQGDSSSLISVLNEIQAIHSFLPMEELKKVSNDLKVSMAKIYGVVTFYSQYKLVKPGKHVIKACAGTACHVKNAFMITNTLKYDYNIEKDKTTEDGVFSMEEVSCLGACALAPIVEIDGEIHGEMEPKKIRRIIKSMKRAEELK